MTSVASVSIGTTPPQPLPAMSRHATDESYTLKSTKDRFRESVAKELNNGRMSPDVNKIVDAIMWPGKSNNVHVQVKTFAADGIQAKDIIFIQRVPPVADGPNIVLNVPGKEGPSFHAFKTLEEMNTWLRTLAKDPEQLETFSQHFAEGSDPAKKARFIDSMTRFKDSDINAVVGPYANEGDDIFARLDKGPSAPPVSVNGLTNIKQERTTPEGRVLYSGEQVNGEKVLFEYDAYGNFLGEDKHKNFYFVNNGLNNHKPLVAMTLSEFKSKVQNEAANHVGTNDIRGLYEELLTHLEHPSAAIGDALQAFGVNRDTANTVERYFDNPFSALLLDLNKNNQIGKVFGLEKPTMDSVLATTGDIAQGFVPLYGQARGLGTLLAKALRNEPLSVQETKDLADSLALKPDNPARKNLPASQTPREPANVANTKDPVPETKPVEQNKDTAAPPTPHGAKPQAAVPAEPPANRLRPSQWNDISSYAITEGEQLISGATPNAKGIYQVKGAKGEDRWMIRLTDDKGTSRVHEIDGKFKLRDGYVQIIDPFTKKPVMSVHSTGDGAWTPINGPGGIKLPWQAGSSRASPFDPAAYDYPAGQSSAPKVTEKIAKQLKQDANNYHKNAPTKARPAYSQITPNTPLKDVIHSVLQKSPGAIFGEDHSQSAVLRVLIDHAEDFKNNQVKTLYSEGFEHSLQPDLDRFFETGEFSSALRENVKLIDRAHNGHEPYTNRNLLLTMRKHGIRIKAIDVPSVEPISQRLKNMNYYSAKVIERDQLLNPQDKWIARVGSSHVFTYDGEPPVRGISQLTGATGINIDDALPNKETSVTQSRDTTEIYIDLK